jgi:hypothetical protein
LVGGKPTVRKAQSLGGNRMTRDANAGGRKAAGNRESGAGPFYQRFSDNWPDTGPGARL